MNFSSHSFPRRRCCIYALNENNQDNPIKIVKYTALVYARATTDIMNIPPTQIQSLLELGSYSIMSVLA